MPSSVKSHRNEDLMALLSDERSDLRMLSLHLLGEAYAASPEILERIFAAWDKWGPEQAYPEFPMLSHVPIAGDAIRESCDRAKDMVRGRKLTETVCRCAGKLIEQLVRLSPTELAPYRSLIEETVALSKIFFRVDLADLRDRLELMGAAPDQLAGLLDKTIARLAEQAEDPVALRRGLIVLETLRREHPDYLDLRNVLAAGKQSSPHTTASFQLTLKSLIQFEQTGLEDSLAAYLPSSEEALCSSVVEALVRCGTHDAAEALLDSLLEAETENRKWIARGLQRLRVKGISSRLGQLRDTTSDPYLWVMLLIAEVRQFEVESSERLARDLQRLRSPSETLLEALLVYLKINRQAVADQSIHTVVLDYATRVHDGFAQRMRF